MCSPHECKLRCVEEMIRRSGREPRNIVLGNAALPVSALDWCERTCPKMEATRGQ